MINAADPAGTGPKRGARDIALGLHGATEPASAGLVLPGLPEMSLDQPGARAAISLAESVAELLTQARLAPQDLSVIGVSRGPGSFTGIKVALATAFGLSLGSGAPLVGLDTTEVVVAHEGVSGVSAVVLPAGRGDVYAARYHVENGGLPRPLAAPMLCLEETLEDVLREGGDVLLLCDMELPVRLTTPFRTVRKACLNGVGRAVARLAAARREEAGAAIPSPLYLRRTWTEEAQGR